jgi:hypothetical protein
MSISDLIRRIVSIGLDGAVADDDQRLSNLVTELIIAHEAGEPLPEIEVHLETLAAIETALSDPTTDMPNAMRLQLTRQVRDLQLLKQRIVRGIRIIALAGRTVLFDPDQIANCVPLMIRGLMSRSGYLDCESRTFGVEIDLFTGRKRRLCIAIPLSHDELNELLCHLGPGDPPLSVLQVPHSCSQLPRDIRLFKAFPAMVVEVVWRDAYEGDDLKAAKLCDYDRWRFGLA